MIVLLVGLAVAGDDRLERGRCAASSDFQLGLVESAGFGAVLAMILGITMVTTEFRHGTITPTFLAAPSRERVLASKALAGTLVFAARSAALAARDRGGRAAVADDHRRRDPLLRRRGRDPRGSRSLLSAVLWGLMGVAIGRSCTARWRRSSARSSGSSSSRTCWSGLLGLLDSDGVTAYLPFHALDAADGTGGDNLLSYWPAVAVSLGWIALLGAAGTGAYPPPRHHLTYPAAMAAPVKMDEEVELQIDSLAYGGNGVARLNGFVVFVRRGLPGDRVRARVTKVKRGFAEALATEVLEPSPSRVDAPCAHYPACGGCRFQDLAYEVQAAAKEDQVRDALKRIGGIADAAARADPPGRLASSSTATSSSTRSRRPRPAPRSASTRPGAGTRCSRSRSAGSRPTSATRSGTPSATGRARRTSRPTTRPSTPATSATSSSARAGTPARCSSCS